MFANFSKFAESIRKCRLTRTRNTGYFMGGGGFIRNVGDNVEATTAL